MSLVMCSDASQQPPPPSAPKLEEAISALKHLSEEKKDDEFTELVKQLEQKPDDRKDGTIAIGAWRIVLNKKLFKVTVGSGPIFANYEGSFSFNDEKKVWDATISLEQHN
ncbi:MAG: hypothetical protein ACREJ2_18485 [Planctomycetota bacterium]